MKQLDELTVSVTFLAESKKHQHGRGGPRPQGRGSLLQAQTDRIAFRIDDNTVLGRSWLKLSNNRTALDRPRDRKVKIIDSDV